MDRGYISPSENMSWSRSKGNIGISATEGNVSTSPISRLQGRSSKKGDEEEVTRKRIRVACSRCRKRKIKCSGPIGGEDQPCLNCKNAGTNTSCAFELNGSMKIDISRLTFASQDYPYQISSGIPLASVYSQEQQYFAAGGNLGSFNGPTYTGHPTDQRDLVTLGYTNPVTSTSGYYGYSEAVTNYNQHPSQWNNIQTSFHDTTSDQMTQWNSGFDDGYATYQESIPRVSLRTSLLATQLPVTTQSQTPFPVLDTLNSASSGRVLPKLTELPLTSESEMPFPTEAEDRVSWASSCGSRQNSDASHNISQELPTVQSSFNQSGPALIRQDRLNQGRALHMYPTLSHKIPESAHTMATVPSLMAPSPYGNQQLSDRYHYNFSPARPAELSNSTLRSNSTIGNHTLNLLPYRGRCAELGTLQYEIHNGVPKAASRIAVESGGNGRTSQRR